MSDVPNNILDKVLKLLALAKNNTNEFEAESAFLTCQRLMAEHGLKMSEIEEASKIEVEAGSEDAFVSMNRQVITERLLRVVADNFRCKFYITWAYKKVYQEEFNHTYWAKFRHLIIIGLEEDRAIALAVFRAANAALEMFGAKEKGRQARIDYKMGFINGLARKFKEQRASMATSMALMLVTPTEVIEKYQSLGLITAKSSALSFTISDAFSRGEVDGKRWDTNQVLSEVYK